MKLKRNTRLKTFMTASTIVTALLVCLLLSNGLRSIASINKKLDLSQKQLLLLSSLAYMDDADELKPVQELLDSKKTNDVIDPNKCDFATGGFKPSQEITLLNAIENDDILSDLVAIDSYTADITAIAYVHKDCVGMKDAEAVIVFQGTKPYDEPWLDNLKGTTVTDTVLQLEAGKFFEQVEETYNISHVTGHSKGGNLAQYTTIVHGNNVRKTISFDGQGFSQLFIDKYSEQINANAYKITSISSYKDIVHAILTPIASRIVFIKTNENLDPLNSHLASVLYDEKFFDDNGMYKAEYFTTETSTVKAVAKFSNLVASNISHKFYNRTIELITPSLASSMAILEKTYTHEDMAFLKALYREFLVYNSK